MARRKTQSQLESFGRKSDLSEKQINVYNTLQPDMLLSFRDIANILKINTHAVTPRLRELLDKGLIVQDGKKTCKDTNRSVSLYRRATMEERRNFTPAPEKTLVNMHTGISFNPKSKTWVAYFNSKIIANEKSFNEAVNKLKEAALTHITGGQ